MLLLVTWSSERDNLSSGDKAVSVQVLITDFGAVDFLGFLFHSRLGPEAALSSQC